jgi:hypothetical protein
MTQSGTRRNSTVVHVQHSAALANSPLLSCRTLATAHKRNAQHNHAHTAKTANCYDTLWWLNAHTRCYFRLHLSRAAAVQDTTDLPPTSWSRMSSGQSFSTCWSTLMIADTTWVFTVSTCMRSTEPFVYFL